MKTLEKMLERFWFGCGHCDGGASCPFAADMEAAAKAPKIGMAKLPVPLTAAMVFLFPLACAIGGAYSCARMWAGDSINSASGWHALGGLGGLLIGAVAARLILSGLDRLWTYLGRGDA